MDLRGCYLSGVDLTRANLFAADLLEARLSHAVLRGANLSRARLSQAILSRADLSDADLSYSILSGANLADADLSHALLSEVAGLTSEQLDAAASTDETTVPDYLAKDPS